MTIGVRFKRDLDGPWSPWIKVPTDDIGVVMQLAAVHFCEHPIPNIGGPKLTAPEEKKR